MLILLPTNGFRTFKCQFHYLDWWTYISYSFTLQYDCFYDSRVNTNHNGGITVYCSYQFLCKCKVRLKKIKGKQEKVANKWTSLSTQLQFKKHKRKRKLKWQKHRSILQEGVCILFKSLLEKRQGRKWQNFCTGFFFIVDVWQIVCSHGRYMTYGSLYLWLKLRMKQEGKQMSLALCLSARKMQVPGQSVNADSWFVITFSVQERPVRKRCDWVKICIYIFVLITLCTQHQRFCQNYILVDGAERKLIQCSGKGTCYIYKNMNNIRT